MRTVLPNKSISADAPARLSRPSYRKRVGRGGRIFIDRIGFGRNHAESISGKTKPSDPYERAVKRFKYDSDEMTDDEEEVDDMQDRYVIGHAIRCIENACSNNSLKIFFFFSSHQQDYCDIKVSS